MNVVFTLVLYIKFAHSLYYTVGNLRKAASAVATFLAREPSDNPMATNVRYYVSEWKLLPEQFIPRQVSDLFL